MGVAGLMILLSYLYWKELRQYKLVPQPDFMGFDSKYLKGGATLMQRSYRLPGAPVPR
jgi:hypothetical protein